MDRLDPGSTWSVNRGIGAREVSEREPAEPGGPHSGLEVGHQDISYGKAERKLKLLDVI